MIDGDDWFQSKDNRMSKLNYGCLNWIRLPGRLSAKQTAEVLGFTEHDIPVLVRRKLLRPLGKPPPNGIKFFASSIISELASDLRWLDQASQAITGNWHQKNQRKRSPEIQRQNVQHRGPQPEASQIPSKLNCGAASPTA